MKNKNLRVLCSGLTGIGIITANVGIAMASPKKHQGQQAESKSMDSSVTADTSPDALLPVFLKALNERKAPDKPIGIKGNNYQYVTDASSVKLVGTKGTNLGTYTISTKATRSGINIETPHGESDLGTRRIGELLCLEQDYDTCATNTIHRREFDFAHQPVSPFQTFTQALVEHDPKALVVQLHGFEGGKRKGGREQNARMILSVGDDNTPLVEALQDLKLDTDPTILVYGKGTRDLGATGNAQRQLIESLGKGHFLHIEMAPAVREKLAVSRTDRDFLNSIIREVKKKYDEKSQLSSRSKKTIPCPVTGTTAPC